MVCSTEAMCTPVIYRAVVYIAVVLNAVIKLSRVQFSDVKFTVQYNEDAIPHPPVQSPFMTQCLKVAAVGWSSLNK